MYIIQASGSGSLEDRVRQAVAQRHRAGQSLPQYVLAREVADGAPLCVDGFLVLGSWLLGPGELCLVTHEAGRPRVFDERPRRTGPAARGDA